MDVMAASTTPAAMGTTHVFPRMSSPPDDMDDQYGELSVLFNLSAGEIDQIFNNITESSKETVAHNYVVTGWLFALNVISGFGVLTNSLLVFIIVADFIVDSRRRTLTRHWLLLCMALTTVALLGIEIYMREFGHTFGQDERVCLVLQHTSKTIEFVIILYLNVIAIHVIGSVLRPGTGCGKRHVLFWVTFILFIMVCANIAVLAVFTMKLETAFPDGTSCQLDPTSALSRSGVHLVAMVTFYIPYGIVLTLVFSALACSFVFQRKLTRTLTDDNEYSISRKYATIFIFITTTTGFLLMLPFYMFQIPEIADVLMSRLKVEFLIVYFVTLVVKLVFYLIFPILCLVLSEIRDIYSKLVSS